MIQSMLPMINAATQTLPTSPLQTSQQALLNSFPVPSIAPWFAAPTTPLQTLAKDNQWIIAETFLNNI